MQRQLQVWFRRECLDHVIVFNEASIYRHVKSFIAYYYDSTTHLSLANNRLKPRPGHPRKLGTVDRAALSTPL